MRQLACKEFECSSALGQVGKIYPLFTNTHLIRVSPLRENLPPPEKWGPLESKNRPNST